MAERESGVPGLLLLVPLSPQVGGVSEAVGGDHVPEILEGK